jgi:hypothetical protein
MTLRMTLGLIAVVLLTPSVALATGRERAHDVRQAALVRAQEALKGQGGTTHELKRIASYPWSLLKVAVQNEVNVLRSLPGRITRVFSADPKAYESVNLLWMNHEGSFYREAETTLAMRGPGLMEKTTRYFKRRAKSMRSPMGFADVEFINARTGATLSSAHLTGLLEGTGIGRSYEIRQKSY